MWEWLAAIGWALGSVVGGIVLYRWVRFFRTLRGIIAIFAFGVLSGAIHNLLNAMFSMDEPFLFLLAIFAFGMAPVFLLQWAFAIALRLYGQWGKR